MKKYISLFLLLVSFHINAELFLIDRIDTVIFGLEGTEIITRSDVERPSLTGAKRELDEIVFERCMLLDAKKHKVMPDDDAVDKYLANIQRENNLSQEQLKGVFGSAGYSFDEGREQLRNMQAANTMLDFKVRSNLLVPKKEIEKYYNEHPEYAQPKYKLAYALIPFLGDQDEQEAQLKSAIKKGKELSDVTWAKPFWVEKDDIAQEKQFIYSMNPGEIKLVKSTRGFELYKLNAKKERELRPLEERIVEISDILRKPRYGELMDAYQQELFSKNSIVHLN